MSTTKTRTRPIHVLVVDDDDDDLFLTRECLEDAGTYEISEARSYDEAIALVRHLSYDVILTDYYLGKNNGVELIGAIASSHATVPIILLTGREDTDVDQAAMRDGAADYLAKGTVSADSLDRSIRHALERARLADQLEQARHESLRLKDEFLSHVSHELRTPITAIYQFATIMRDGLAGSVTDEQREYLEISIRNAEQLTEMVEALLDVTRCENGQFAISLEACDIAAHVAMSLQTLSASASEGGVRLVNAFPSDLPHVFADPARLQQVVSNLVGNAIKFTPTGGSITISGAVRGGHIRVDVTDTGIGISPDAAERVFERMQQEATEMHQARQGLGLGLYMCREIVERSNGEIWLDSEPGQGSTFSFTLPIAGFDTNLEPT